MEEEEAELKNELRTSEIPAGSTALARGSGIEGGAPPPQPCVRTRDYDPRLRSCISQDTQCQLSASTDLRFNR